MTFDAIAGKLELYVRIPSLSSQGQRPNAVHGTYDCGSACKKDPGDGVIGVE